MLVSEIEWDTDGHHPSELGLPQELEIDVVSEGIADHDALTDWLSDKYGWTVNAYLSGTDFPEADAPTAMAT